jgi:hypothetical protein
VTSPESTTPPSPSAVLAAHPIDPSAPITTKEQLRDHLLQAAAVEMQTIPMYLYAAYSIAAKGNSRWDPGIGALRLIRSIVIEEMLHLCLVRNLLVAIGFKDSVRFYDENFVPDYPEYMLHRHPPLALELGPCTSDLVRNIFMEFERPLARPGEGDPPEGQYATIGQFYDSIRKGIEHCDQTLGPALWADHRRDLQYVAAYWNVDGGGHPLPVIDLKTALAAVKLIVEQGEGADPANPSVPIDPLDPKPGLDELPHYTKFQRIADKIEPAGPLWRLPTSPKGFEYRQDEAATAINDLFNAVYCYVLHLIDVVYATSSDDLQAGAKSRRWELERLFLSAMQGLLANLAEIMVARPLHSSLGQHTIGPTFEYVRLPETGKKKRLIDLCDKAMVHFPELGGDNSVRWLMDKMPDV